MAEFFNRQRKMGQWALAYAAAAWELLQVLSYDQSCNEDATGEAAGGAE